MKRLYKNIIKWAITLIILAASLYLALSDIQLPKLWSELKAVNYIWVLIPVPIMLLSHYFRAIRWKTMLSPIMKSKSVGNLFSAVMIGYFFNNVIPRGGEFIRPYVYAQKEKVSYSSVFATIILERLIDLITLMLLFGAAFLYLHEVIFAALPKEIDPVKLFTLGAMIVGVIILSAYPPFVIFFLRRIIRPFSPKLYHKLIEIYSKFRKGFDIIKKPSQYFRLIVESLLIWFCYSLPMFFVFFAFSFQQVLELGITDAVLLVIVGGVAVTVAPSPGAFGVYHLALKEAMVNLYGLSPETALAYAFVTHLANFLVQVLVGGALFLKEDISFSSPFSKLNIEVEPSNNK